MHKEIREKYFEIFQTNAITASRHEFTLIEKQIVYTIIQSLNNADKINFHANLTIEIDYGILLENAKSHREIKQACRQLVNRTLEINTENEWHYFSIVSSVSMPKRTTLAIFEINKKALPHFCQLKNVYEKTGFFIRLALTLKSIYSQRFYELISRYKDTGIYIVKVQELKSILKIENKYPQYFDFKKRVIEVAKKELNQKTDLQFNYEPYKKQGRKIISLKFFISTTNAGQKLKKLISLSPTEKIQKEKLMSVCKLDNKQANKIIKNLDIETTQKFIKYIVSKKQSEKINNIQAYAWTVYKNNFINPKINQNG